MSRKKSVRSCLAGLVFALTLVATPSTTTHADTVVATIEVGTSPYSLAINPAGTFAYVANYGSNTVSKINLSDFTVEKTITGVQSAGHVAINPAGTFAYVVNKSAAKVSKINLSTDTVVAEIRGVLADQVAINPAGTFAYVTNNTHNKVAKINLSTDNVVGRTYWEDTGGVFFYSVTIDPAGTFAYVMKSSGTVSKINLSTDTVVATITVDVTRRTSPYSLAINPAGTFAYVTNYGSNTISKINLSTDTVVATITVGTSPYSLAINPAGTFAYVTNLVGGTVSKIALTSTDPQLITFTSIGKFSFPAPLSQLFGAKSVTVAATASSGFSVSFSSSTKSVCTVSGSTVTMITVGDCTINANQPGGPGFDAAAQVSRTFAILPSPPAGEVGVSIKNGDSYSNSKQVTLNLIWPEYAAGVRISNDGGFAASKTQTKDLAASINWELDDSIKGVFTKVVYIRFNGVADTTKTYSDDIILDTTAPTIETSSAAVTSSSVDVTLKASDDITGVSKVQIRSDAKTVTKDYATKVSVPLSDLSLSVSSSGVRKSAAASVEIRVSDNAENWTGWQTVTVAGLTKTPAVTAPTVTISKLATAKSIATFAKIPVLSTSKVSLKVVSSYAKYCKVAGTTLKGLKAGSCKVTVTVTPKKGKATSKTVTLKVSK